MWFHSYHGLEWKNNNKGGKWLGACFDSRTGVNEVWTTLTHIYLVITEKIIKVSKVCL